MTTGSTIRRRFRRRWTAAFMAAVVIASATGVVFAAPSSFVELDGNIIDNTPTTPASAPYDWGSLFTGGVFNGQNTPPTAPTLAVNDPTIAAAAFQVDPLSADVTECGTGDPTVFTGQGSEKNGGDLNVFTINTSSVPGKDDISNVYAVAHIATGVNEVFFGAERIINNGDSHIDFEFLQSPLSIPAGCGVRTLSGHRSMGDLLLVVDFTRGGTLGGTQLYEWHCVAENQTQPADGTVCDPTGAKPAAHYQQASNNAVAFLVNGAGDIACGDWACRSDNGSQQTVVNTNEFMEGGIDLSALGFTGCFSSLLPHTRSSQSFTATLKDLEVINFNTCKTPAIATQVKKVSDNSNVTPATPIETGVAVYDTATLTNATADAGGTVTYKLYTDNTCTTLSTTPAMNVTVTVTNGVVPASNTVAGGSVSFSDGGTWYFQANYSGDARNTVPAGGLKSACTSETVVVKNNPAVSTTIKNASNVAIGNTAQTIGVVLHDTATITGATATAGGTITYQLFNNATCSTASGGLIATLTPSPNTVVNGVAPDSQTFTFNNAGTFYFYAVYSGDANNTGPVNSGCASEPVTINPNTPAVSTTIKNASNVAIGNTAQSIGVVLHDTATITGATATAGGTITYQLFNNATCSTASGGLIATLTPSPNTVVNGVAPDSQTFTFNNAGTFYFYAVYSGDANNTGPVNSGCASEPVTINPNNPAPHSTPVVQIKDTFSATGFTANATGSVVVGLYTNDTCTTRLAGTSDTTVALSTAVGGAISGETTFVGVLAGTYYYKMSYLGDANNTSFSSCAEIVGVSITPLP